MKRYEVAFFRDGLKVIDGNGKPTDHYDQSGLEDWLNSFPSNYHSTFMFDSAGRCMVIMKREEDDDVR